MSADVKVDGAALLRLLGVQVRWDIVRRLAVEDLCTCHLVADLDLPQPLVSHHLRALREAGVVRAEPAGAFTYYALERHVLVELADLLGDLAGEPRGGARRRACP